MRPKRIELLGVPLDCVDLPLALSAVEEMMRDDRPGMVIAVNPEKVIKAIKSPVLLDPLREARLLIPDGIGVVMAARLLGLGRMKRVPGSELMPAICERAARKGYRVFLFGGGPEVNRDTMDALRRRFPGIQIVGGQHGYLKEEEMPGLIDRINASKAEVLFVALGSPKQEIWMKRYLPRLNIKVCQGVGGTFDVLAGRVKRAPAVIRKVHLEWLYRLLSEPRRLVRQTALPRFAVRVLRQFVIG
ncbi:MAG TPA: WecB/TagA/CpsF family glycosyltransferase [Nitrospiria bacterium]|jgi:N-acetylglucosaminyldiphosphoundecaprenol N-acetyl-beta-D-mannosaminyltransferase|nr:WecB/TagA/CpsF family glycosyltransferase [Nitrospiria bacterium]